MDGMTMGIAIGFGGGLATGIGSGMAIGFGGSSRRGAASLRKKLEALLADGSIRVTDGQGQPIPADKLAELLSKGKSS